MRLTLLSGFAMFAGLSFFGSTANAQIPAVPTAPAVTVPNYAPGSYFYSNGYLYQVPARPYYATRPVYSSTVNPNGAMTGRVSHNFDPTGRGITLAKPWLRPLR